MASSLLPGLTSLPWSCCRRRHFQFFSASGSATSSLYGTRLQTAIAMERGCRMHITRTLCLSSSDMPPNPPTSTNAPLATEEKEFTTLPPIEEEENPNPIIPPSVDFPMPTELPPHRIDKPVTVIAGASRGLGLELDTANEALSGVTEDCCSTDSEKSTNDVSSMDSPTKTTNRIIALTSAAAAVGLFLATRGGFSGVTLGELAATALPYEEALSNGRPTVLEFYADWCEVCREMAPDVYKVEQQYKDEVNFVMLNVDNTKWEQELDEFGVEGIPHFAFLDKQGNEEGNIVGRLPKKYLEDNVLALSKGEDKLPHSRVVGQFSNPESHQASRMAEPRSHGS